MKEISGGLKGIGIGWRGALVALLGVLLLRYGTFAVIVERRIVRWRHASTR